jgi:GTP-binding protein
MLDTERVDIAEFEEFVADNGWELIYVSAATGKGLDQMIKRTAEMLRELPPMLIYEPEYTSVDEYVESARETVIRRENDTFYVEGDWLYNLMGQINFDDYESLNYFQKVLKNSGVFAMLEAKGCADGHTVSIYDFEFDYVK